MEKIQIKQKEHNENIEIYFRYVYESKQVDDRTEEKAIEHAFFAKKGSSKSQIKKQIKEIIKEQLARKKATETEEEIEIDLED